jgi:TatD DNase family protein
VVHTARKVAEIKGISFEEVAAVTTANAKAVFGIP